MAVYSTENKGHFGLALDAYGHFTSPIRRYPDLLLHRSIKHALIKGSEDGFGYTGAEMAVLCVQCSEKERRADEASREVDERYRSAWMEKHVGSEFDGVISGVTSFGLFVELAQSKVNGLVHVTQLPHDYYHFDPLRKSLKGERKGTSYRLGDAVRDLPRVFAPPVPPPSDVTDVRVYCGGCLVVGTASFAADPQAPRRVAAHPAFAGWPLVVVSDEPERATRSDMNFLWTTFTRFEPAADICSAAQQVVRNHIAYEPPVVIDARMKPWYPAEVTCRPDVASKVGSRWAEYFPGGRVEMGDAERGHLD